MSVALVAIGDELLLGETREANAAALAVALRRRGLQLGSAHVIGAAPSPSASAYPWFATPTPRRPCAHATHSVGGR